MQIAAVPAFQDNYIWVIRDEFRAAVVDPGDARPVLAYLAREKLSLTAILCTHHHADHVGGCAALLQHFPAPVYAPKDPRIADAGIRVAEGDCAELPEFSLKFKVMEIPGHTASHIAYYGANLLFCGDTLFGCGCGRLFEGTPAQMVASLSKLASLPDKTLIYCGHEYTLNNIRFAKAAEPGNPAIFEREKKDRKAIEQGRPSLPSSLGLEKATNPFLRCGEPEIIASASRRAGRPLVGAVAVFAAIREWKNQF